MFKCLFSSGDALDAFDAHLTHCNLAQISISGTVESELDPTIALEFSWRVPGAKKSCVFNEKTITTSNQNLEIMENNYGTMIVMNYDCDERL
jgi:hypothetical protein